MTLHVPEHSLPLDPSVTPTLFPAHRLQFYAPVSVPSGGIGFHEPHDHLTLFLGYLYPDDAAPLMDTQHVPSGPVSNPEWLDSRLGPHPVLEVFLRVLWQKNPVASRAMYIYCHAVLQQRADRDPGSMPAAFVRALLTERTLWSSRDEEWINTYVRPRIKSRDGHWLWQGKYGTKRPSITWHGQQNVSIYRLLWPLKRPLDLLVSNERLRKTVACPDPEFRACVNPDHFEHSLPLAPVIHSRANGPSGYTRYRHKWNTANVHRVFRDGREIEEVRCPLDHPFPPRVQNDYWTQMYRDHSPFPQGEATCAECRQRYRSETGGKRQARGVERQNDRLRMEARQNDLHEAYKALREAGMMPDESIT